MSNYEVFSQFKITDTQLKLYCHTKENCVTIALEKLEGYLKNDFPQRKDHYKTLENGQSPATLFITCSDSRLVPNETVKSKAGELFVIRNAGNLIPACTETSATNESLTLEYAVSVLKVKEIIVCGHVKCGAMGGILGLDTLKGFKEIHRQLETCSHQFDRAWLNELRESKDQDHALKILIDENVKQQMRNIRSYPFVASALEKGELEMQGWVYDFVHGEVITKVSVKDI
jgi:carbonic anhydrase